MRIEIDWEGTRIVVENSAATLETFAGDRYVRSGEVLQMLEDAHGRASRAVREAPTEE